MNDADFVLPEGGRLLHIGPHKTGSTTLQQAFHQNRDVLAEHGVHYAGKNAQPMIAAMMAASGKGLATSGGNAADAWGRLVEEIDGATLPRVMISSEFFCEASPARIRAILDDLGADRTTVVVTLRPLARIVASQWQQYMQNRFVVSYDDWLRAMFVTPEQTAVTPSFWRRHRHDVLVRRWVDVAGPDRVRLVVVDESDPHMLVRSFESMLGVPSASLAPSNVSANRSLTFREVEYVRAFNQVWRDRGWSEADYTRLVRFGAVRTLQERVPPPDEARVLTPAWAADLIEKAARDVVTGLEELRSRGVPVIGDLGALTAPLAPAAVGDNETVAQVPVDIAARFAAGLVRNLESLPPVEPASGGNPGPLEEAMRLRLSARRAVAARDRLLARRAEADRLAALSWGEISRSVAGRVRSRLRRG